MTRNPLRWMAAGMIVVITIVGPALPKMGIDTVNVAISFA